jgi:tetratricopeptide (TPR) repeat protein
MHKILVSILIIVAFSGCKSSFKSGFRNFNAYYNTYYNAKKSFNLGEEKSLKQARKYNTLLPIQVYETPMGAGSSDFENAIEKGANVLRKYKETKWVDNALEIIGKSYFYRKEYFNAMEKFDELYLSSDDELLKQRSIFWKGRVLLELQAYNEGVQFLTEQLSKLEGEWKGNLEHQISVVLAEHYVARENWVVALDLLNEHVPGIPGRANKERGYFLIGQLNEMLGDSEGAFTAFDNVSKYYTVYDLQFEAKKKKAEVARAIGDTDEAYRVFSSMVRDDKNTEFVAELNFELGKTEQDRGRYREAQKIYRTILRDPLNKPDNLTKARVYNGLAEINRFHHNDFKLAAAYYDSSAKLNVPADQLPETYNARELAKSFGDYARLKDEIHLQDSLLWLGSLSSEEFDSVLVTIREQKIAELEQLMKEQEEQRNTLVNTNRNAANRGAQSTERNGFLNVKNPVLIEQTKEQFNAVWGNRPLVDNWRVGVLMQSAIALQEAEAGNGEDGAQQEDQKYNITIDLSRIPFTYQAQDSVREEIAALKYELGNLFFLALDLPDSAIIYFNKVLDERPNSPVAPVSLYSLSELYDISGDTVLAKEKATLLINTYPESKFASHIATKFDLEIQQITRETTTTPIQLYLALNADDDMPQLQKAIELVALSEQYPEERFSDRALFEAIENYIRIARDEPGFTDSQRTWNKLHNDWAGKVVEFNNLKDSASIALSDTSMDLSVSKSLMGTGVRLPILWA